MVVRNLHSVCVLLSVWLSPPARSDTCLVAFPACLSHMLSGGAAGAEAGRHRVQEPLLLGLHPGEPTARSLVSAPPVCIRLARGRSHASVSRCLAVLVHASPVCLPCTHLSSTRCTTPCLARASGEGGPRGWPPQPVCVALAAAKEPQPKPQPKPQPICIALSGE